MKLINFLTKKIIKCKRSGINPEQLKRDIEIYISCEKDFKVKKELVGLYFSF